MLTLVAYSHIDENGSVEKASMAFLQEPPLSK